MKRKTIIGVCTIVFCLVLIPLTADAETFWSFGFGASSYSFGGYFNGGYSYGSPCVVPTVPVVPVIPVMPYGCSTTIVVGSSPFYTPHPHVCYHSYNNWFNGYYYHPYTYYYGGAYHPGPPPIHCPIPYHSHHYYHYHPYSYHHPYYQRIHINHCNNCNIYGRHRRYP